MNGSEENYKILISDKFKSIKTSDSGGIESYTTVDEEYDALRHGVGLRDLNCYAVFNVRGADTQDFIHRISTNAVDKLDVLEKVNTLFTTEKGRIIDRTTFIKFEDYFLLIGSCEAAGKLNRWISRYIIMEDVRLELSNDTHLFEVIGPQAESYLLLLFGKDMEKIEDNKVVRTQFEDFFVHILKFTEVDGNNKYWVLVEDKHTAKLFRHLLDSNTLFDLKLIGEESYKIYRVEQGIPASPNELSDEFNPHEIKLTSEVSTTKGCYIGQEVIARLETYSKIQKELKGIKFSNITGKNGSPIVLSDKEGAEVIKFTTVTKSKLLKSDFALGLVRKKFLEGDIDDLFYNDEKVSVSIYDLPVKK